MQENSGYGITFCKICCRLVLSSVMTTQQHIFPSLSVEIHGTNFLKTYTGKNWLALGQIKIKENLESFFVEICTSTFPWHKPCPGFWHVPFNALAFCICKKMTYLYSSLDFVVFFITNMSCTGKKMFFFKKGTNSIAWFFGSPLCFLSKRH